jgi:lipopolysaccharide exporter
MLKKYFSSYWIRSAFYTFLQRFSLTFFGLINFMVLIRTLSKSQMGAWALFLIVTSIFESTKSALIKNAHIRYVSSVDINKEKTTIASASLLINGMISLLFILFILFFSGWLSVWLNTGTELAIMLRWFIPGLISMVFFSHLEAIQQSHLDFKGVFAGHFIRQIIFFLIILGHFVLRLSFSLGDLALYQGISIGVGTLVLYLYSRKYMLHRFDPTLAWIKRILGYGGYIFGSGIISNIFANVDQIMTAKFLSSSAVASYNAASRINLLVDIPSYSASEILFPKASRASVEEGPAKVKYLYERMVAILMSFTTPAAIIVIIFPKLIISVIAGPAYFDAALILQLYMITGILRPMQNQAANLLNSIGKPHLCFVMNAVSLCANLIINYICLRSFGFYGAAIGTLITLTLVSLAWYFIMKQQIGFELLNVIKYMKDFYKSLYTHSKKILSKVKNA